MTWQSLVQLDGALNILQIVMEIITYNLSKALQLLQPLRWCCVKCVIHHEQDVREEQHYTYMWREQAIIEWSWRELYCCLLPQCEALRTCRSDFRSQHNVIFIFSDLCTIGKAVCLPLHYHIRKGNFDRFCSDIFNRTSSLKSGTLLRGLPRLRRFQVCLVRRTATDRLTRACPSTQAFAVTSTCSTAECRWKSLMSWKWQWRENLVTLWLILPNIDQWKSTVASAVNFDLGSIE